MKDENKESSVQIGLLTALVQILWVMGWGFLFVILLLAMILAYLHFSWMTIMGTWLVGLGFVCIAEAGNRKARRYLNQLQNHEIKR